MTRKPIETIIECCRHFKFWYSQYSANKEVTLLGVPYKGYNVFVHEYSDKTMSIQITNGIWEYNPKHFSMIMPVEKPEDLLVPFHVAKLDDVVSYLKEKFSQIHHYHLGIIDHNVSIPKEIDKEYDSIDEAYEALSAFVHSYDGVMQVDGRVMDEDDEDIEYSSSIM